MRDEVGGQCAHRHKVDISVTRGKHSVGKRRVQCYGRRVREPVDAARVLRLLGPIEVHHFDFYSQALAKIDRGHERDLSDVEAMKTRGLIEPQRLQQFFHEIEPALIRYPAIDAAVFARKVHVLMERWQ